MNRLWKNGIALLAVVAVASCDDGVTVEVGTQPRADRTNKRETTSPLSGRVIVPSQEQADADAAEMIDETNADHEFLRLKAEIESDRR